MFVDGISRLVPDRGAQQGLKRGKNPDALIKQVGEKDSASQIDNQAGGSGDLCVKRGSAVAAETSDASAGNRADDAGCRIHATNPIVHRVGDVDVPCAVNGNSAGIAEHSASCRTAFAAKPTPVHHNPQNAETHSGTYARDGRDDSAGGINLSNSMFCSQNTGRSLLRSGSLNTATRICS